jgi:hypothetical protein
MKINNYLLLIPLFALLLAGCGDESLTPATTATTTADLLVRKWVFNDISVKTNAKTYVIPSGVNDILLEGGRPVTFLKNGTYTVPDSTGKLVTSKWTLVDKKLTLTDADNPSQPTSFTIANISATDLTLATQSVDVTKDRKAGDTKFYGPIELVEYFLSFLFAAPTTAYKPEEIGTALLSLIFLSALDKENGPPYGNVDFKKEPAIKTVQLLMGGKAQ